MEIKMNKTAAGPRGNWMAGQVYDTPGSVSEADALALVEAGAATRLDTPVKPIALPPVEEIETASIEPPEQATSKRGKRKGR